MIDDAELEILRRANGTAEVLDVVVHACAYSCCGRGWRRKDGYEQSYCGRIDNLTEPDEQHGGHGTFMLYSMGVGTLSYVLAVRFDEVEVVQAR